jgi:hypothetical protein
MKKMMICLLLSGVFLYGQAQDQKTEPKKLRVFAGASYAYNETVMKLLYMNEQYTWNGNPSEAGELEQDKLDELNSREKFTRRFQGVTIEAGMVILDKPSIPWHIDGSLMVGLASSWYQIWNKQRDSADMQISSGFSLPTLGIHFNIGYQFNPHWGVVAVPHVAYSFGKNTKIDDQIYGSIENFDETREYTYNYLYGRLNLMAAYTIKTVTIEAGPGFYLLYNTNHYTIDRRNPATTDSYKTDVRTRLISKSFLDGSLSVDWRIIPVLSVSAMVAVGNDVTARGSVRYYF